MIQEGWAIFIFSKAKSTVGAKHLDEGVNGWEVSGLISKSYDRGMKTIERNETERWDRLFGFFSFFI